MNFKRQGRAFVHSACNPGPSRPRKVRSTPFPPDSENCVRFLARPLPTRPASLGSCGGPNYGGGRIGWCSVLHPAYKGGCPQLLVSLTLPCAVFSCGQFNTVRLMHTRCRAPAAHGTRLAHDRTEKGPPPGWWRSFLFGFLFYIETWLSALIFMLFQIFGHHFDDQIRDGAFFLFRLYFDPPFQIF